MNRRTFLANASALTVGTVVVSGWNFRFAQTGFTELRGGVGIFEQRGGTIGWLVSEDAVVVVDTQFPDAALVCLEGLNERSARPLDLVINSHHHGDHTAGNGVFVPAAKESVAHENVPVLQKAAAERRGNLDDQTYVRDTYSTEWSISIGKEKVSLSYFGPAHTGGDSVAHFENANIVHMGDLVFNRLPPYIDRSANATVAGWIEVLERTYKSFDDETLFMYGHGNEEHGVTGSRADLHVMRDYLSALREYVEEGIAAGNTAEELVVPRLPGFEGHYNEGWQEAVPNGIKAAYEEFSGQS